MLIRDAQPGSLVANNTIYQPVGDAIRVQDSSTGLRLENNILYVAAGYDLYVTPDSQNGFISDYNLFYRSPAVNARVGFWNGADRPLLGDWQVAKAKICIRSPATRCLSIPTAPTICWAIQRRAWG